MLDRYWFGDVSRISPEAPVPVARIGRMEERAGGAANVARNIASLGGKASILSVVGDDEAATALERLMKEDGIRTLFKRDAAISTTIKLRVVARQQQLIRLDFEDAPSHEILADKLEQYQEVLAEHDVVILSDYGKGGLTHVARMIELARAAGKPVLIDPKGDDYAKYAGATLLTPNRSEFKEVAGSWQNEEQLIAKAQALRSQLQLDALLVTRSEEGMTCSVPMAPCISLPLPAKYLMCPVPVIRSSVRWAWLWQPAYRCRWP
jgi:rfaE bifunctional protein kinase chain/domain